MEEALSFGKHTQKRLIHLIVTIGSIEKGTTGRAHAQQDPRGVAQDLPWYLATGYR